MKFTCLFYLRTIIIFIEMNTVLLLAKIAKTYAFLVCNIFGPKFRLCKIFDKFQVWPPTLPIATLNRYTPNFSGGAKSGPGVIGLPSSTLQSQPIRKVLISKKN